MRRLLGGPSAIDVGDAPGSGERAGAVHTLWILSVAAAIALLWRIDAPGFVGDELNALHYLRPSLLEYVREHHSLHLLTLQFWLANAAFEGSFVAYRLPAALSALGTAIWVLTLRLPGLRNDLGGRALVLTLLLANGWFAYFGRWGIAPFAEAILVGSLLVGTLLKDAMRGVAPRWTLPRLAMFVALPWLYPGSLLLLGGITAWLVFDSLRRLDGDGPRVNPSAKLREVAYGLVPALAGALSHLAQRMMIPDAHWQRARSHHLAFADWAAGHDGSAMGYLLHMVWGVLRSFVPPKWSTDAVASSWHSILLVLLAVAVSAVLLAPLLAWFRSRSRARADRGPAETAVLRGMAFLSVTAAATFAGIWVAGLLGAYPVVADLRRTLYLIPVVLALALVSLAYLHHRLLDRTGERGATTAYRLLMILAVLVQTAFVARAHSAQAAAGERLWTSLRAPQLDAVLAWQPGFFFPRAMLPESALLVRRNRPADGVPAELLGLLGDARSVRLAVFGPTAIVRRDLRDGEALGALTACLGFDPVDEASTKRFTVVDLERGAVSDDAVMRVNSRLRLPSTPIRAVRLELADRPGSVVDVERIALSGSEIDICGDPDLLRVRTAPTEYTTDGACRLVFDDGSDPGSGKSGWIAPSALRDLPATEGPRTLELTAHGELATRVRVFFDTGEGYSSKQSVTAPACFVRGERQFVRARLPSTALRAVRLQPSDRPGSTIALERVALSGRAIDVCDDAGLYRVRTSSGERTADGACRMVFGDRSGVRPELPGWIVPSALRDLPAVDVTRSLEISMRGEIGPHVRIFLDTGAGFSSKQSIVVPSARW